MGLGKEKNRVRLRIAKWQCEGQYGYGQGRAVREFGQDYLKGRSACDDVCKQKEECRRKHFDTMDEKFPVVAEMVKTAVIEAKKEGQPILQSVIMMMRAAASQKDPEAQKIQEGLNAFGIHDMTDHFVYGQLCNIKRGLDGERITPLDKELGMASDDSESEFKNKKDQTCP